MKWFGPILLKEGDAVWKYDISPTESLGNGYYKQLCNPYVCQLSRYKGGVFPKFEYFAGGSSFAKDIGTVRGMF